MRDQRLVYPVSLMAQTLGVSRSGFYAWLHRGPSDRQLRHACLEGTLLRVHLAARQTYGTRRVLAEVRQMGLNAGRDQISFLRKKFGLRCVQRRKYVVTTRSTHGMPIVDNLLMQDFRTQGPGQVWGTDITYVRTLEGWLYLAAVKDFHTREVLGYSMSSRMTDELVRTALRRAIAYRKPEPGCICHSDQGSQYCSSAYQLDLLRARMKPSMSRRGNCWDNAPTESLWSTLKQELIRDRVYLTRTEAEQEIREYLEIFYNRLRRHSSLGNLPPAIYARNTLKQRRSA